MALLFLILFVAIYLLEGFSWRQIAIKLGVPKEANKAFVPFARTSLKLYLAGMNRKLMYLWWLCIPSYIIGVLIRWFGIFDGVQETKGWLESGAQTSIEDLLSDKYAGIFFLIGLIPFLIILMIANMRIYRKRGYTRLFAIFPHIEIELCLFWFSISTIVEMFTLTGCACEGKGIAKEDVLSTLDYFIIGLVCLELINSLILLFVAFIDKKNDNKNNLFPLK